MNMELVSEVAIEKRKKCLMENYSLNFNFWDSQNNSCELKTKYVTVCDSGKKTFSRLPAFLSVKLYY